MPLQIRRGTEAERQTLASPLVSGELLWITDDFKLYIGDGNTLAKDLAPVTGYGDANARDAAASIFTAGTHTGISFVYNGATAIDAVVSVPALLENLSLNGFDVTGDGNISITGAITATSFVGDYKGSISADDSTILVDALDGSINLSGTVKGDIIPNQFEAYDIGSFSNPFRTIHLSATGLYLENAHVTATGTSVNLPTGSTIGGFPIATTDLILGSNYNINIVGDDSSLIVDSSTNSINADSISANIVSASFVGDLKGSVFTDDSSALVDAIDRKFFGTVDTSDAMLNTTSITNTGAAPFTIGTDDSPIDLQLVLGDNLQVRSVDPNGKGYITSTMSRGTHVSPAAVQAGDEIGGILFRAYTDDVTVAQAGIINFAIDPTAVISGGSFVKSQLIMGTATDSALDPNSAFVLDSTGTATTNVFAATKFFQLPVFADDSARSTAIPTPAAGMMIFMTSGTTPAATNKMQLFDGTNWININ